MRANFRMQRLYIEASLAEGVALEATAEQFNYLANVLRMTDGAEILLFNGRDGEWRAKLAFPSRKKIVLVPSNRRGLSQTPRTCIIFSRR